MGNALTSLPEVKCSPKKVQTFYLLKTGPSHVQFLNRKKRQFCRPHPFSTAWPLSDPVLRMKPYTSKKCPRWSKYCGSFIVRFIQFSKKKNTSQLQCLQVGHSKPLIPRQERQGTQQGANGRQGVACDPCSRKSRTGGGEKLGTTGGQRGVKYERHRGPNHQHLPQHSCHPQTGHPQHLT